MKVLIKVLYKYCCAIVRIAFACGCSRIDSESTVTTEPPKLKYYRNDIAGDIYSIAIEGHLYIIARVYYGVGIIHAEHCPCKNTRE